MLLSQEVTVPVQGEISLSPNLTKNFAFSTDGKPEADREAPQEMIL
jgi:hypothetical protein